MRVRAQVKRDFNPVSISCGYRVSCAEMLGVDGFLARWVARAECNQRAPAARQVYAWVRLISSKNL